MTEQVTEGKELKKTIKNKPLLDTKRLIGIIIGVIIIFTVRSLLHFVNGNYILYIAWILTAFGGLVVSFIAGGNYKDGVINGFIAGFIAGALLFFYFGESGGTFFLASLFGFSLAFAILSLIGGLIGIFIIKHRGMGK
jgi:hypothetical protein